MITHTVNGDMMTIVNNAYAGVTSVSKREAIYLAIANLGPAGELISIDVYGLEDRGLENQEKIEAFYSEYRSLL
jgi:hypothetical protein